MTEREMRLTSKLSHFRRVTEWWDYNKTGPRRLDMPLMIYTRSALEPANYDGFGPLSTKIGHPCVKALIPATLQPVAQHLIPPWR
jgi:hypothetical protein